MIVGFTAPQKSRAHFGALQSVRFNADQFWDEVNFDLSPKAFTIRSALARMESFETDPVFPMLEINPDLSEVLGNAEELLASRLNSLLTIFVY